MRRINSPKQTEASRANGAQSKGPKSPRVRLNALKDGLFSKDIVIESAGERRQDFEQLKKEIWDFFQPANALEEMLVTDIIENWWRRQRVRRAESADLRNRLETSSIRDNLRRADEIESLKDRFLNLLRNYVIASSSQPSQSTSAITAELEEVRQQLAGTSLGVEFLIKRMEGVASEAQEKGQNSPQSMATISACCGFGNEMEQMCLKSNLVIVRKFGKTSGSPSNKGDSGLSGLSYDDDELIRVARALTSRNDQNGKKATTGGQKSGPGENEDPKAEQRRAEAEKAGKKGTEDEGPELDRNMATQMLLLGIRDVIFWLRKRKQTLEYVENWEARTRTAASIYPAGASDRFLRAETTIERRMYRSLVMLLTLRSESNVPKKLA